MSKDISAAYQKKTHREHILSLPDTYIGSIANVEEEVFVREGDQFVKRALQINPGFYKLIDELLVNAHDQVVRLRTRNSTNPVKKITISADSTHFYIENDGEPIDVVQHPEHKVWVPQMIFAELLTSTNYDASEKKLVGGKNGYGVKLVNIFAKHMEVMIIDAERKLSYQQRYSMNMTRINEPTVKASKSKSSVAVKWEPDFERFGMKEITPDMLRLIERRVWDLAMTVGKETKVIWNGETLKCKNLVEYADSYGCSPVVYESPNERWHIAIGQAEDGAYNQSFVNGIWTSKGGTHVDTLVNQITTHIVEYLETKKKTKVKPSLVKDQLAVFCVSMIENPSFTSQTKETLTTKASAFGSSPKLSEETLKKIVSKLKIVETLIEAQAAKDSKDNTKTDGKKQSRITGIPKLDDAVYAGTAQSAKCTLILTEGDSAKAMALSGLSQEQRKFYGVYPLKGKILNVKDTSDSKVEHTKEIAELKKILGLQSGKKYETIADLRYGSVMIMTDQDYDGSHIRGLLINLFHELWHELMAIPGFLTYMATPIVKAVKGTTVKNFYSQYEYEEWRKTDASKGFKIKYYKGLGTSTRDEAKDYFTKPQGVQFEFITGSDEAIDLAFNKKRADDRKVWLQGYDKSALIPTGLKLPYTDFIHKDLEPILRESFGVVIFHEHVLRILNVMTGCTLAKADELRRSLEDPRAKSTIETFFRTKAKERSYSHAVIERVWQILEGFSSFGFCKAHGAAFALPTYQSAWLKTHYPVEFMAGLFTHDPGMYPKRLLMAEARRLGVRVLPIDVNKSSDEYLVEKTPDGLAVRLAIHEIAGISEAEVARILSGRPYSDIGDFYMRAKPSRRTFERIAQVGGLDELRLGDFGPMHTRGDVLARVRQLNASKNRKYLDPNQPTFDFDFKDLPTGLPEPSNAEKVEAELQILNLDFTEHALEQYRPMLDEMGVMRSDELVELRSKTDVLVAGIRVATQTPPMRSGKRVVFVSLDDGSGCSDSTFFDEAQKRCSHILFNTRLLLISGKTRRTGVRGVSIMAENAWDLRDLWQQWLQKKAG